MGPGHDATGRLRLRLLDGFAVGVDGRAIPDAAWPSRKARQLLKLLALAPGHRVHRDEALEALWPDLTAGGATRALYQVLFLLRRTLEPGAPRRGASRYVRLDRDGVALVAPGGVETDLAAFERAAAAARGTGATSDLRAALALGGELLPDDRYEEWTLGPRRALREQRLALLSALAATHERAGQPEDAAAALREVLELEPAHEPAHAGLMRLYAAAGRRDEALRQYERLKRALREELGAAPDAATQRLHAALLDGPPPENPPAVAAPGTTAPASGDTAPPALAAEPVPAPAPAALPRQLTSFVGRDAEVAEVARLLREAPLVTLTGPGGVGKTRLALEVAGQAAGAWPDGIGFVDLASVADPGLVPQAVASALGLREAPGQPLLATLAGALGRRRLLLVLDNCEHLVAACAALAAALLRDCPGLRALATSREPLGVAGEAPYRVPSLAVPDEDDPLPAALLARVEAVRLFAARAAVVQPGFAVTERNATPVAAVCRRLDGLPLAIELAAAQVRALSVEQLATRLDDRFRLLIGGPRTALARHQTLRAAVDWSFDLLTPQEQTLFARLSVFAGGFALEAAEAVGAGDSSGAFGAGASPGASGRALAAPGVLEAPDVLEVLTRLVDKSLVTATPVDEVEGAARYRLLETLRQYGRERLRAAGDAGAAHDRHAAHFLARTEALGGRVERAAMRLSAEEFGWFAREHDNLRAALGWLRDRGAAERALRLGAALGRVWFHLGYLSEGRAWLRELLALPGAAAPPAPPELRALALDTSAGLARRQGDYDAARALHEEALVLVRSAGDRPAEVWSLNRLAVLAAVAGDAGTARARVGEMLAAAEALGDPAWRAEGDFVLGLVAVLCHEYPAARTHLEAALAVWRPAGHRLRSGYVLASLATAALGLGDRAGARAHLAEALGTARAFGDQTLTAWSFELLARAAAAAGQPTRAARLAGAAAALRALMSAPMSTDEAELLERDLARVQRAIGPERYRAAQAAGAALTPEEAVAEALAVGEEMTDTAGPDAPPLRPPVPAGGTPSTEGLPRQLTSFVGRDSEVAEVARLLHDAPLVTLTGPGGVGKTRLALEAAGRIAPAWPDGARFVDLAPLADAALVPQAVAAALGVREAPGQPLAATLADRLRQQRLLLVLDNCEHLVAAVAPLAEGLLRACPAAHLLATSREPLGVPGETEFRVAPLAAPPDDRAVSAAQLRAFPATRLFLERAAPRGAVVGDAHSGAVAQICRRLDGLPLAIELAAARLGALRAEELASRLEQRFRLLTAGSRTAPPRQQTLRATVDWSYALLTGPERMLFGRLAVFSGGFTLAAEAVCGEGLDVLDLLPRLVDKSLVVVEPALPGDRDDASGGADASAAGPRGPSAGSDGTEGTTRYRLLETLRVYARERLEADGEAPAVAARHADHYLAAVRGAPEELRRLLTPVGGPSLGWLTRELDNLRAALRWCLEHAAVVRGLAFAAGPMWKLWGLGGRHAEGRGRIDAFLERGQDLPPWLRAAAHTSVGLSAQYMGDYAESRALLERAVALWGATGESSFHSHAALCALGIARWLDGDDAGAVAAIEESLTRAEAEGASLAMMRALRDLSHVARTRGDYATARALLERSLAAARQHASAGIHGLRSAAWLGRVLHLEGRQPEAAAQLRDALAAMVREGVTDYVTDTLEWLAPVLNARGRPRDAAVLLGAAAAGHRTTHRLRFPRDDLAYQLDVAAVRAALTPEAFSAAVTEGERMELTEAAAYALDVSAAIG